MNFKPKTSLGFFSVIMIALFFLLIVISLLIVKIQGPRENQTFLDNIPLTITGFLSIATALTAFFSGLISVIKHKERSIFVYVAIIIGFFVLFFIVGESLVPN